MNSSSIVLMALVVRLDSIFKDSLAKEKEKVERNEQKMRETKGFFPNLQDTKPRSPPEFVQDTFTHSGVDDGLHRLCLFPFLDRVRGIR